MRRTSRVMASAAVTAALLISSGTGVAAATTDTTGMTYAKAKEQLTNAGETVGIATVAGSDLSTNDCIVVNQTVRDAVKFGNDQKPKKILLSLNCYGGFASGGKPGSSAASPEGRKAKTDADAQAKEWRQSTPDGQQWCADRFASHPDWTVPDGCPQVVVPPSA